MANSSVINIRIEKDNNEIWSRMRGFSFPKSDAFFVRWNSGPNRPIIKHIPSQNIVPIMYALKRGLTFNHDIHENSSTISVFLNFWEQINHQTERKWQALC